MKQRKIIIFIICTISMMFIVVLICIAKFSEKKEPIMEVYFQLSTGERLNGDKLLYDEFTWYCPAYYIAIYDNGKMHIISSDYSKSLRHLWIPETTENWEKIYIGENNTRESDFIPKPDFKNDVKLSEADIQFVKNHLDSINKLWVEEKTLKHALGWHSNEYMHFYKYNGNYFETYWTDFYSKEENNVPDEYPKELLSNVEELNSFFESYIPEIYREPDQIKKTFDTHYISENK